MLVGKFVEKAKKEGVLSAAKTASKYVYDRVMAKVRPAVLNSYSQFGEDGDIDSLLKFKKTGFYVDVGANDPNLISNTKRFYKKGWRGINIEPNVDNYKKFLIERERDINLNLGVGPVEGEMEFYLFDPNELSTFSASEAAKYEKLGYKLVEKKKVRVEPLAKILEENSKNEKIDFLSVDAEGYDLEVLKSNDWERFRPKVVCVEIAEHGTGKRHEDIDEFLVQNGYSLAKFNGLNGIYVDSEQRVINDKMNNE